MTQPTYDIRLENVIKRYGDTAVLDGVDLTIAHGEFVCVLGRSGTGKSTLLNLIGGLDEPTSGEIELLGRRLGDLDETRRAALRAHELGFVFQFFNLIPTLTARENVELPLALCGQSQAAAQTRAQALLNDLGVGDCAQRFPDDMSGGEQQRVAIARALVHRPAVVLADEPTGNLDIDTGNDVLALLRDSCRSANATLVMATHSHEAVELADRVLGISQSIVTEQLR
jgi:putative ABC transport system ATP-binding protein